MPLALICTCCLWSLLNQVPESIQHLVLSNVPFCSELRDGFDESSSEAMKKSRVTRLDFTEDYANSVVEPTTTEELQR